MMYIFCEGKRRNSLVGVKKYAKKKQTHTTNYKIFIIIEVTQQKSSLGALMCHRHRVCSHQHVDYCVAENDYYCSPGIRDDDDTLFFAFVSFALKRAIHIVFLSRAF